MRAMVAGLMAALASREKPRPGMRLKEFSRRVLARCRARLSQLRKALHSGSLFRKTLSAFTCHVAKVLPHYTLSCSRAHAGLRPWAAPTSVCLSKRV